MPPIPKAALRLIAFFEGFRSRPYRCPAGIWTIGRGSTRYENGKRVAGTDPEITEGRADEIVEHECKAVDRVNARLVKVPLARHERAALISFSFNVGTGNFAASTMRMKLNRGDRIGAAQEFPKWRRAGGRILRGLVRRRAAERRLFEGMK